MRKQLDKDSEEIYPTQFMFADGKDAIELKIESQNEAPGLLIAMESPTKVFIIASTYPFSESYS